MQVFVAGKKLKNRARSLLIKERLRAFLFGDLFFWKDFGKIDLFGIDQRKAATLTDLAPFG